MKKIAIIVGTRPEVIKMAPLYLEMKASKSFKPIFINTGQHIEMTKQMLKWFGIKEDYNLNLMKKNQSLDGLTARALEASTKVLQKIRPDLIMVEGDTATVMAVSIAAFYLKIPIAHVEAGLRTHHAYNPFPEEMSRRLVSRLATYHFAPTKEAVSNLKREGITKNVYMVGNTVIDALLYTTTRLRACDFDWKIGTDKINFKTNRVLLVTMHRRENFGKPHKDIAKALIKILNKYPDTIVLLPLHKNPKVRTVLKGILSKHPRAFLTEPLDYVPFVYAMQNSYLILTDSGGVQEEAPSLGKPVLVLRENTERPEGIKAGTSKLVGIDPKKIISTTSQLLSRSAMYKKMTKAKNPYGSGHAAKDIVGFLNKIL